MRTLAGMPARSPLTDSDIQPLAATLDLTRIDDHLFVADAHPGESTRAFGGEVAGCAIVAAGRSVPPERRIHSAHCHFVRAGDSALPIVHRVHPVRDGRTYSVMRVEAIQHDRVIFHLTASFTADPGDGSLAHQLPVEPARPADDLLPPWEEYAEHPTTHAWLRWLLARRPIDLRFPEPPAFHQVEVEGAAPSRQRAWMRAADPLPDDGLLHAGALAYLSDLGILSSALSAHGRTFRDPAVRFATLDHTVWFHEVPDVADWVLYETTGLWTGAGRGLAHGTLTASDGRLVATTMQEGMLRLAL